MTKKFSYKVHGFVILGVIILLLGLYWQVSIPGNCAGWYDCLPTNMNGDFSTRMIIALDPYKTHIVLSLLATSTMCFAIAAINAWRAKKKAC
jgi:hypothetical protein